MTTAPREYTVLFPFCGLGAGARGFLDAQVTLFGEPIRFRSLGGIDIDAASCADFEYLTDSPALLADLGQLTVAELRAFAGERAPDVVFASPPCKGYSGLLSKKAANKTKYRRLNRLVLDWVRLMLEAWPDAPPRLFLLENVPRIATRGRRLLRAVRSRLRKAGYVFHEDSHDCGELGGLAQHRVRYLLVARREDSVRQLLYKPIAKRVRACGEVLEKLPVPGTAAAVAAGPMHVLPALSWLNWVRLALIPAGGDWRDLPNVLAESQARREVFRRHHVGEWSEPAATVAGSGSNGPSAIADPRIVPQPENPQMHWGKYEIRAWDEPAATVIGAGRVGSGAQSVADPRIGPGDGPWSGRGTYGVVPWSEPSGTVQGESNPSSGAFSVADPRFGNVERVTAWTDAVGTVTTSPAPSSGAAAVSDPRVRSAYDHGYQVLRWTDPSPTVAGGSAVGQGAYAVADARAAVAMLHVDDAAATVHGETAIDRFAIARPGEPTVALVDGAKRTPFLLDGKRRRPVHVVILSRDGTWHRPLTTLELAALQGLPIVWNGAPLKLHGDGVSAWRERIGNAVPVATATAIAEQMLVCLGANDAERFLLSSGGAAWVEPEERAAL